MKAPRLININLGVRHEEKVIVDTSGGKLDEEIYWRLGTGRINGRDLAVERKKCLDGSYEYRIGNTLINNSDVECWYAREWMDWRDA